MSYTKILSDLKQKKFKPIYLFDGDEPYYIDALSNYIAENVLDEAQKEFNQSVLYARDLAPEDLSPIVKRYPMMAPYQVVIVREAQNWSKKLSKLEEIVANPVDTTILVINYKGKKIDGRKKLVKLAKEKGVYFSSNQLRDYEVPKWIDQHCKTNNIDISPQAVGMLSEHIGANLGNLISAFDKLEILLPKGEKITPQAITKHIGISKDFNIFELQRAVGENDHYKALFIANYYANNQKEHNIIPVISGLYRYFNQLITYLSLRNNTDKQSLAKEMGVHPYFIGQFQQAAANYSKERLVQSIEILYDTELKAKGVTNSNTDGGQLVREMVGKLVRV